MQDDDLETKGFRSSFEEEIEYSMKLLDPVEAELKGTGQKTLGRHFPKAHHHYLEFFGDALDYKAQKFRDGALGSELNRKMLEERARFAQIQRHLAQSIELLSSLEREGKILLLNAMHDITWNEPVEVDRPRDAYPPYANEVTDEVIGHLGQQLELIERTQKEIENWGHWEERKRGRQPNLIAQDIARSCMEIFELLSDHKATIRVRTSDNKAYGPFLELVSDVFKAYSIDGSPETHARAVIKKAKEAKTETLGLSSF